MKELSIDEKAKRYDEALNRCREFYETLGNAKLKEEVEEIFPELAESEDERIRKYILSHLQGHLDAAREFTSKGISSPFSAEEIKMLEASVAWLEKQCEKGTNGNEREIPNSEQKPADKVEPKFKVGDWVVRNGETLQISGIDTVLDGTFHYWFTKGTWLSSKKMKNAMLWTIQDAKDGDVLADGVGVILFRKIGNKKDANVVDYHCAVFKSGSFIIQKGVSYWGYSNDEQLRPATKEQCERFFATMRDVGYEWDADKKELKKLREE